MKYIWVLLILAAAQFQPLRAGNLQAKIGVLIKSGESISNLRANDIVRQNNEMQILVKPLSGSCFVYVLFFQNDQVNLLNVKPFKAARFEVLALPASNEYFRFDAKSTKANLIIIASKEKLESIENLFGGSRSIPVSRWKTVESKMSLLAMNDIKDESKKPFNIAGNVRGSLQDFINSLPALTGNSILTRTYDIEIKK